MSDYQQNTPPRSCLHCDGRFSVTAKERNSSVELFRILATLSVLAVHFNGWFIGGLPNVLDFHHVTWHWGQFLIDAATCVCVNLFIIISGYFGLKFKISSFVHIGLLLIGIFIPLYVIGGLMDGSFCLKGLVAQLFFISKGGYFVQCYLMLLFLSPLLNWFVKNNSRKSVLVWTLLLWVIEIWFGCVRNTEALAFMNGYSVIHFVLIYMIARCVRLYQNELLRIKKGFWVIGYVVCTVIIWFMSGMGIHWGYANPINVISSFCCFMPFLYFEFYSKQINWISKSTFAVYIIQVSYPVLGLLCSLDLFMLDRLPYGMYLLASFGSILLVFCLSIVYDKILWLFFAPVENIIKKVIGENRYNLSQFNS